MNDIYFCGYYGDDVFFCNVRTESKFDAKPFFEGYGIRKHFFNSKVLKESLEKAFRLSNIRFPDKVKVDFISPNDITYPVLCDLAVAISILSENFDFGIKGKTLVMGGFTENGTLLNEKIAVAACIEAVNQGFSNIVCTNEDFILIKKYAKNLNVIHGNSLKNIKDRLLQENSFLVSFNDSLGKGSDEDFDSFFKYCDPRVIRSLSIAAAGRHNILLAGGRKSFKAFYVNNVLRRITPNLNFKEMRETERLLSLAGVLNSGGAVNAPFIEIGKSDVQENIIGGGRNCFPGKVSAATNGILFLNDYFSYKKTVIDAVLPTVKNHRVNVSFYDRSVEIPCNYQLAATMSPCFCENLLTGGCSCTKSQIDSFYKSLAPYEDSFEICCFVADKNVDPTFVSLDDVREDISNAYEIQRRRGMYNSRISCFKDKDVLLFADDIEGADTIPDRVKRVSLTIANMEGRNVIEKRDLKEAEDVCSTLRSQLDSLRYVGIDLNLGDELLARLGVGAKKMRAEHSSSIEM